MFKTGKIIFTWSLTKTGASTNALKFRPSKDKIEPARVLLYLISAYGQSGWPKCWFLQLQIHGLVI